METISEPAPETKVQMISNVVCTIGNRCNRYKNIIFTKTVAIRSIHIYKLTLLITNC